MKTKTIISNILARKEGEGGITSVYFVACGGSLAAMYPAKYLLESESIFPLPLAITRTGRQHII